MRRKRKQKTSSGEKNPEVRAAGRRRLAAARLRNLLDQKTGREKRTLRRYVQALEKLVRGRP